MLDAFKALGVSTVELPWPKEGFGWAQEQAPSDLYGKADKYHLTAGGLEAFAPAAISKFAEWSGGRPTLLITDSSFTAHDYLYSNK